MMRDRSGSVRKPGPTAGTPLARPCAAEHAAVAGRLSVLLDDAVYPTVADLTRLLPVLSAVASTELAPVVGVLRMAGPRAHPLPPPQRANLFALTAAHLGHPTLTRRYHQPGGPTIRWAHSHGSAHQPLTGHTGGVWAVAVGRLGDRDVIVSGSTDASVRVWDAATGQPVGAPLTGHTGIVTLGRSKSLDHRAIY
jgi:hypothetical protein